MVTKGGAVRKQRDRLRLKLRPPVNRGLNIDTLKTAIARRLPRLRR